MNKNLLELEETVFKNKEVLSIDYIPETVLFRDNEIKSIIRNIESLITENITRNTLISGKTCTGKTTVVKKALEEIEENTTLKTCYINCNVQNTARKCYFQIYSILFSEDAKPTISTEFVQKAIITKLKEEEEPFVIAVDDINNLSTKDYNNLIKELLKLNELYHIKLALIIVFDDESFKSTLEYRVYSNLRHEIAFENYTSEEMYTILKHRCDLGFKNGVISDNQIKEISDYIADNGTLRKTLVLLDSLGEQLEIEGRTTVTDNDINDMIKHF